MSSAPAGPRSMGMNTVTTVMAFSVSAFFVLFVFTRLFCARIHLRAAAAEHAAAAQASDAVSFPAIHVERGIRGMEPSVVTTFPTAKLGAGDDSQRPPAQEESQCTVCLEEYEAKDVVRVLPYCGHAFHAACIDTWLRQHPTCPICRSTTKHRAAAGTMPPAYYTVAMAAPPTSSSDQGALQQADAATAAVGAERMDVITSTRLEIVVSDESASSGATCPIANLAPPFQVPTSSSDHDALRQANPDAASATAAVGTDHMDMDVMSTRLEIVISDEPASSGAPCPSAATAPSASEEHPCAETRRQSSQGNASEHCQC